MDFDQLLLRFFGTSDLSALSNDQILEGVEKLRDQFGAEADPEDRFALWCLLYMLGAAPEPDDVFDDEEDREAARDFMDSMDEDD